MNAARAIQSPTLLVPCPECEGYGELLTDTPPRGRYVRCGECAGDGQVGARCACGDPATVLVENSEPACAVCSEDYVQGPAPLGRAPWQEEPC